ncbi:CLUMA_CG018229, isoform A [Clunio marinus]|uniref:CLUMA_CG018229, isoform A n=1 Tax=Clunio marinus TaxID=568069 RepID=A0A1J1J164_9DIPT|nr:CLUMA_CG018229, isoform A [Clunio marinus]
MLSKFYIDKAKSELREDETRKSQSLAQFREWISKHPFLSEARKDESYLLQFLRSRKYNMDEAFQLFERIYLSRKRYPKFFDIDQEVVEKAYDLYEAGYCYPLSGRTKDGQRVVLIQTKKLDTEKFTIFDGSRLLCFVIQALLEEEETQIAGIILVFDHSGANIKHLMLPMDFRDFMDLSLKCSMYRQKGFYILNIPTFGQILFDIFKSVLSEKLRNRIHTLKPDDLKNHIDPEMLPVEYGGVKNEEEMKEEFKKVRDEKKEIWDHLLHFEVDWSKVPKEKIWSNSEEETVGSFRKLEID